MELPLYEQLFAYLVDEIKAGRLKAGERVPSEKELAEQFKVSRITSKKALEKLDQAGIIERARGKGSFVAQEIPDLAQLTPSARPKVASTAYSGEEERRLVGLIMPDFSDSYGMKLLHSIEERCSEQKYLMLMKRTYGEREEEEQAIRAFTQLGVDGLVVFPVHGEYYNADLLRLVLDGFPLVLVDRYLKGIPACAVYTDNSKAAQELTGYLLDQGHEHIAFLSPPSENTSTIEERIQGYSMAFAQRNMKITPEYLFSNLMSTLPGAFHGDKIRQDQETIRQFLEQHPQITAFVACEYNIALLIAQLLQSLGKRVPEDYAIACFDSPDSPFGISTFTHIQQDEAAMGREAVDLLASQLAGREVPLHNVIEFKLVEGRSTASPVSKR